MSAIFPHPLLSLAITVMWLMLTRFSLGHLVLGSIIAIAAGLAMTRLQMPRPHIRNWGKLFKLAMYVGIDIIRSNIAVARIILRGPDHIYTRSGFMELQLTLRDRNALALLAIILTATPGTAWLEYDPVSGRLLIHVLDLVDPEEWKTVIHDRYEVLLMEIFE